MLQATEREEGVLADKLGCYGDVRGILQVHGMGTRYANQGWVLGDTEWVFEGQEIFKRAVVGMSQACETVLTARGLKADDVHLVVPHQANLRIIEAVVKRAGIPMERCFVNIQRYGNMSSATVPVALVEALEEGRVTPGCNLLLTGFGAGLSWSAHVLRWGERTTPLGTSDVELPPCPKSALELVRGYMAVKQGSRLKASRLSELFVEADEGVGRACDILAPVRGGIVVGAVAHVLRAGETRALDAAGLGERIGFHVHDVACDALRARRERIAGAADGFGQSVEARGKLEHRRQLVEWRHARWRIRAPPTSMSRSTNRRQATSVRAANADAAGRAEVHDERRPAALATQARDAAGQRDRGIDLADAGVEHVDAVLLEAAGALGRQCHDDEDQGRLTRHSQ